MHVSGLLCGNKLDFLVDSGASHNFISMEQLKKFGVHAHEGPVVNVRLAD